MAVVNNVGLAERGISLLENHNDTLTKSEEKKQFILRLVANHRKNFPTPSKTSHKYVVDYPLAAEKFI